MAKKIVKTLLVGLGGTGNKALKYAKKRYYEMYSEGQSIETFDIPLIEYLALDTYEEDLKKGVGENNEFGLKKAEYLLLEESNPRRLLSQNSFIKREWFPKMENFTALEAGNGAGQIRSLGRLSLMSNFSKIKRAVKRKVENLTNWEKNQNDEYEVVGTKINVVYCFSVSGGTGSGTFLDIAYSVKEALDQAIGIENCTSQAYIVLPEIFDKIIDNPLGKKRIYANAYAALRELEFYMSGKADGKELQLLNTGNNNIKIDGQPFNLVHLVSSQNSEGDSFEKIDHIMELIGNNIVLKSGEFEADAQGGWSQVGGEIATFDYLDEAKTIMPRYLGLGYAEIKYNTAHLVNYASAKYAAQLADMIISSEYPINDLTLEQKVQLWGIKEDEADDVIDKLLPPGSFTRFVLDSDAYDGSNTRGPLEQKAAAHISHQEQTLKNNSNENLEVFSKNTISKIVSDLVEKDQCILDKGGINTVIDLINKLQDSPFIERYSQQMNDEISIDYADSGKGLDDSIDLVEKRITDDLDELAKAQETNIFVRKSNCIPIIESLVASYNKLLDYKLQKIRREDAKIFYNKLNQELDRLKSKLTSFSKVINQVKQTFDNESNDKRKHLKGGLKPFVQNLASSNLSSLGLDLSSIDLSLYLGSNRLFDYTLKSEDEIKDSIFKYISDSPLVKQLSDKSLTTCLKESSREDVVNYFKDLKEMAQPLFQVDKSGFYLQMGDNYQEEELWGVPHLEGQYKLIKTDVDVAANIMETKNDSFVMLSTMHYPAPISSLGNLTKYYDDYYNKKSSISLDTDTRLRKWMDEENFDLIPKDVVAEDKTICAWIFGLVLHKRTNGQQGIFRKGTGKFFIKSGSQGDSLKDYWIDLNTAWRDVAFESFQEKNYEHEILSEVKFYLDSIGGDAVNELINEIKEYYIDKFSNLNRSLADLTNSNDSRDKDVSECLRVEVDFIKRLSIESINDYL